MNFTLFLSNWNFNKVFFIFFIPALVSGPLIPEILIFFLIISYFYNNRSFTEYSKNLNFILIFFFVFYFYLNLNSIFFSFDLKISLKSTLPYLRLIIFSLIISKLLIENDSKNLIKFLIYSSVLLLIILLIDSGIQLFTGKNILGSTYSNGRVSSLFGSEQIMGSFVIKILPIIICFLYLTKLNRKEYYYIFFLISTLILVILSSERVALSHYILIFLIILFIETKNLKFFIIYLFALLLLIFIGLNIYTPSKERIVNATLSQLQSSSTFFYPSYRHELHYFTAFYMFLDNPLFGKGIKSFRYECEKYDIKIQKKIDKDKGIYAPYNGIAKINKEITQNGIKKSIKFFRYNEKLNEVENDFYKEFNYFGKYLKLNPKIHENKIIKKGEIIFSSNEYLNGCNTHPHNYMAQFLAEIGIFGFLFFLVLFLYLLIIFFKIIIFKFKNYKLVNSQKSTFIIVGSLLVELLPFLPSGNFFNNWLSMIFFFKIGVLLFLIRTNYIKKLS